MEIQDKCYREILKSELEKRKLKNPGYSSAAFARDIGITPSRLRDIFNKRYGLSRKSADEIARNLKFLERERNIFCDLVESIHARSESEKHVRLLAATWLPAEHQEPIASLAKFR